MLFPLSLILLFSIVKSVAPTPNAWLAMLLYASNALVLLHSRRAMAEPVLLFTVILTMYVLVRYDRSPWWAAVPAALAFCAKQSAGILILPVIAAIFWQCAYPFQQRLVQAALAGVLFLGSIFISNPFMWNNPLEALRASMQRRTELVDNQVSAISGVNPEKVLGSFTTRIAAQAGQLFFNQPAIWDIGNYITEQRVPEQTYLSKVQHRMLRSPLGGLVFLLFCVYGFTIAVLLAIRQPAAHRGIILLILANLSQMGALLLFVPLPFQRYSLPLVPFICIWSAFGLNKLIELAFAMRKQPRTPDPTH
jgi:4-amino-4-deoxy-L-arabinose transferase-like glycosyltransferase